MTDLTGRRIVIMATDGFEQSELEGPRDGLREAGAKVDIASLETGEIRGWDEDDWGCPVKVDRLIADIDVADYDALVLPGGQINPDLLRAEAVAVDLVKAFHAASKPVAAICHAPWLLIEAGLVKGLTLTAYTSIRTDLANAGATVVDQAVAEDGGLITSRCPDDIPAFTDAVAKAVAKLPERVGENA